MKRRAGDVRRDLQDVQIEQGAVRSHCRNAPSSPQVKRSIQEEAKEKHLVGGSGADHLSRILLPKRASIATKHSRPAHPAPQIRA
eukprot:scaffold7375_cov268-Pinguiococcus_pyrenoidosus.AAC.7